MQSVYINTQLFTSAHNVEKQKYDDNSRYLFEYVNKYHSDIINAIWLTDELEVVEQVRSLGYQAYLTQTKSEYF